MKTTFILALICVITIAGFAQGKPAVFALPKLGLPPGMTLTSTGFLQGTPAPGSWGVWQFTAKACDSATPRRCASLGPLIVMIGPLALPSGMVLPPGFVLPSGMAGVPYAQQLVSRGGTAPYSWTIQQP